MKRLFFVAVLCCLLFVFAGCGSKHYTVTKADGSTVVSVGEPEFSKDSNTYKLENLDGQEVVIKREDVKEIVRNNE
ncbi:YgdI/YgdR family lipoprotein [Maridesulfovibrio sp.]|uniref:YgdI/YgdR family lipoprotein n=1 Tax=Maridesulfovibrio sp. TaxID=2795000 RepID=UPI002A18E669|nr:YgdI/YgdR family lipoprotein [Maridesulfovibrio sp.]